MNVLKPRNPLRLKDITSASDCPYEIKLLCQIRPLRLVLVLGCVGAFAALVPTEPPTVGLMTPVYRLAPGFYGQ